MGSAGSRPTTCLFSTYTHGTRSPVAGIRNAKSKPISRGPLVISLFQSGPPACPSPRCHFPTTPVTYPALFITVAIVVLPGRMIAEASPGRTFDPALRHAYSPVSSEYREGVLVAEVQ